MSWKELVRIALLGSDRTEIPESLQQTMQSLGVETQGDMATALLQTATKLQAQRKAGYIPASFDGERPTGPEVSSERFCSPGATYYLQQMLDGKYENALPEFFQLAKTEGRFLPPEQLPKLLQEAIDQPEQLAVLKPLLGKHARWLMAQHPEWAQLFDEPDPAEWVSSSFQQQVHIFQQLRQSDLPKSIHLLQESWGTLDFRQKKAFLSNMEDTICEKDEIILEPALDDRRKEVRQHAQHLLSKIQNSVLLKRIWERLDPFIQIKEQKTGKEKLMISLPEEVTKEMLRDGLDPSQQWLRGGLKASRLAQMIAIVSTQKWEIKFGKTPEELVSLFAKSDFPVLLLQALSHSAALHQNDDWSISILAFWLSHHHQAPWDSFNPKMLYQQLSAYAFNTIALPALLQCKNLPDETDPFTLLVRKNEHPWEETLTREFTIKCKKWISQNSSSYWTAFHLKTILQNAAYYINPELTDTLTKNWPISAPAWGSWEGDIEQFFRTLRFRQGMRKALKED